MYVAKELGDIHDITPSTLTKQDLYRVLKLLFQFNTAGCSKRLMYKRN